MVASKPKSSYLLFGFPSSARSELVYLQQKLEEGRFREDCGVSGGKIQNYAHLSE